MRFDSALGVVGAFFGPFYPLAFYSRWKPLLSHLHTHPYLCIGANYENDQARRSSNTYFLEFPIILQYCAVGKPHLMVVSTLLLCDKSNNYDFIPIS